MTTTGPIVLLSGDEGSGTLAAVRGLHEHGYRVWLAVAQPDTYAVRSRKRIGTVQVTNPGTDVERHARDLAAEARRIGAAIVMPGTEGSLRAVTGREALFPEGCTVATCAAETLDRATDKRLLSELARAAGLDAPDTFEVSGSVQEDELARLPFPAVAKPLRSVDDAALGLLAGEVEPLPGPAELRALLGSDADRRWLLQPLIHGTLGAVCGVAWNGELVCAAHQRSLRIWPPEQGISSYAVTTVRDLRRERGVAALVASIGWSGVFGVQFLECDETAYVIDFNPRIYGSLALAIAAGLNLPAIWADLVRGLPVSPPAEYRVGVGYRAEEDDYRAILHDFRHGRHEALRGLLPRRHTVHAVFALDDPAPLLTTCQKLVGIFTGRGAAGR